MTALFQRSWTRAWSALTGATNDSLRDELLARYSEPQRRYHTQQHLAECLALFEEVQDLAAHPPEVEIALWFHDAIYEVKGSGNEERSAEWAYEALTGAGASAASAALVRDLVLATKHTAVPTGIDEQVLVDIDLAILGADLARFDEYERQIRDEYSYVPGFLFRRKRKQILKSFLDRPALYSTPRLRDKLEDKARENLQRVTR